MDPNQSQSFATAITAYFAIIGIIAIASIVFSVIVYWRIFSKAGFSGALSLLMFVPIANIVMICILAFAEWPIYQELNMLRQRVAAMDGPRGPVDGPMRGPMGGPQFPPQSPYPPNQGGPQQYPPYPQQDPPYPQNPQYRQG